MEVEAQLHSFVTPTSDGDEMSESLSSCFTHRKELHCPLNKRVGGSHCRLDILEGKVS